MKIKKVQFYLVVSYILLLGYYLFFSMESFVISLVLTPMAGLFLYISFQTNNITLSLFSLFFFISQGIDPPIFYMDKSSFDSQGWNAIGNFDFKLSSFFDIYSNVYILMFVILLFSLLFYSTMPRALNDTSLKNRSSYLSKYKRINHVNANKYSLFLILFIMILIPLNMYMYVNKIAMTGIVSPDLPFRLTGILFYFRVYFVPVMIFYLYMKSNRSLTLSLIVFLYAAISGLSSVSKSAFILGSMPVLFFAALNNNIKGLIYSSFFIIIFVGVVQVSRNVVYGSDAINIIDYVKSIDIKSLFSVPFYKHVQMISSSLFGTQGVILAHQHTLIDQLSAIFDFFSLRPIMRDIAYELYGLEFGEEMNLGVGIGLIASLILLANKNIIILIILGLIISIFLFACEYIVKIYMLRKDIFSALALPLAFFLIFNLYAADMKKFYILVLLSLCLIAFSNTILYKFLNSKISLFRICEPRKKEGIK